MEHFAPRPLGAGLPSATNREDGKMRVNRWVVLGVVAVALVITQAGCCTCFSLSGDGPLKKAELDNWTGLRAPSVPEPQDLQKRMRRLRHVVHDASSGQFMLSGADPLIMPGPSPLVKTSGPVVKTSGDPWYYALAPIPVYHEGICYDHRIEGSRELYGKRRKWGLGLLILDAIMRWRQSDLWDGTSRQRVASSSHQLILTHLGWVQSRHVMPVDANGEPTIRAVLDPKTGLDDVGYDVKHANLLLGGALGFARVNRRYYAQLLWIPIPLWRAVP